MRRITMWIVGTICALALLFSYATSRNDGTNEQASGSDDGGTDSSETSSGSSAATGTADGETYDGDVVETRFGDVQVQAVIADGVLVDVVALQTPSGDRHNDEINGKAVPILRQEALDAQSADIESVSGATYTSEAYSESLQSALDAANFQS